MNKLAQYLNQHINGEIVTEASVLEQYSRDAGPLSYRPQMVAYPNNVSDIRKLLRFTWQLAEKGHVLPVTVRGAGQSVSGAAVGSGIVVVTERELNTIAEYDGKQRLVRLQPGASIASIQNTLGLQAAWLPDLINIDPRTTIGGFVANRQDAASLVKELEVILPNGDVLQTKRLPKREFNKKKGEPTFEGNIYRAIDVLLEENAEILESELSEDNHAGYSGLAQVRGRDGSFDLTPLIVGSQGTLGIISEMIVFSEYLASQQLVLAAVFTTVEDARDALDQIAKQNPESVEFIDGSIIERASENGKNFVSESDENTLVAALIITLADGSARAQVKKQKRIVKTIEDFKGVIDSSFTAKSNERAPVWSLLDAGLRAEKTENRIVTVASGVYVPLERFDEMTKLIEEVAAKRRTPLFVSGQPLKNRWQVRAELHFTTTAGRQTLLALIEDLSAIAVKLGGSLVNGDGEGRLATLSTIKVQSEAVKKLNTEIKAIFDPHAILNPEVKQANELHDLVRHVS